MSYNISSITLSTEKYENYMYEGNQCSSLKSISKINIFIGSNNSGKSRFLRKLFTEDQNLINYAPHEIYRRRINELISSAKQELLGYLSSYSHQNYSQRFIALANSLTEIQYIQSNSDPFSQLKSVINELVEFDNDKVRVGRIYTPTSIIEALNAIGHNYQLRLANIEDTTYHSTFDKIYIPTLRGLRTFGESQDIYKSRTLKDYFNNTGNDGKVFTGLELYSQLKDLLLGTLEEREVVADFQKYLGDTFFDGQSVALIPSVRSDVVNVKIGYEKEQAIYNLGDGIQSIIILTFPLFLNRGKNLLVFIEEPEQYLHPGLQRKLIETFMEFPKYQYFISTHSNHFLDITLDIDEISVFSFRKKLDDSNDKEKIPKFYVENVSNEDNDLLEMLGVRNSSVFLSNCTIWVEGITDRFYLRHYFDKYQNYLLEKGEIKEKYKEDVHFSFVEYSGGNITHWSFLDESADEAFGPMNVDRLCSRLFLVSDKDSEKKRERQDKLQEKLGARYFCLGCKEIENLLTKKVLLQVIADYEKVETDQLRFNINFTEKTYAGRYLGKFIDDNLLEKKRRGRYSSESGTISDKVTFCKKAIGHIEGIGDISEEAIELCKKLFLFIKENN